MCEENKRESFPQEAQDPQPIETQAAAPAEVGETAAPGVGAVPQEGTAQGCHMDPHLMGAAGMGQQPHQG